jgi:sodium/bile acid cotransporter 7
MATKRRKKHKNQNSGLVNSMGYNEQKSKFRLFTNPSISGNRFWGPGVAGIMKKQFKTSRYTIFRIVTAALAFAFVTFEGQLSLSSDDLSDKDKRQKIDDMYAGYKKQFPEVRDLSPQMVMDLRAKGKTVLIDIREPREQQVSMLPGAVTEKDFMDDPAKYKDAVKIAYCTISYRSGKFAQKLQKKGIIVYNLKGGMLAWVHDGGNVFNQNGETHRIHVYGRKWDLGPERYQPVW